MADSLLLNQGLERRESQDDEDTMDYCLFVHYHIFLFFFLVFRYVQYLAGSLS
jgi:hypothetical protein